jgi:cytochrome c
VKAFLQGPGDGYPRTTALAVAASVVALAAASVYAVAAPDTPAGDPSHGRTVYQARTGCHSLDEDDVGREALDRWLTNPQALVPEAKMFFAVPSSQDRADVIAYLAQQH